MLIKQEKNGQSQKQIANEFENSVVPPSKQEESLPRKSINNFKDLTIEPPEQFRDRQKKQRPPRPTRKPPLPPPPKREHEELSSKIKELSRALRGMRSRMGWGFKIV